MLEKVEMTIYMWFSFKTLLLFNAGKDAGKKEHIYDFGKNIN
jgi:hypothetical protein